MNEGIKKFLEKFAQDAELQAKFKALKTPEEAYEAAIAVADGFTKEEFFDAMTKLESSLSADGELSDKDLNNVAGGNVIDDTKESLESVVSTVIGATMQAAKIAKI